MVDHQALIDRFMEVHNLGQWDRLGDVLWEDCVEEYPQSGELFRGLDNIRHIRADYPGMKEQGGGVEPETLQVAAGEDRWVVTKMFTVVRLQDSGTHGTAVFRVRYPDGSTWWNVNFYQLRGDRIERLTVYFAPTFDPPEWREPFRERPKSVAAV